MIINFNDKIDFIYSIHGFLLYKKNMMSLCRHKIKDNIVMNNENFWSFIFDIGQYISKSEYFLIDEVVYINKEKFKVNAQLMSVLELTNSGKNLFEKNGISINKNGIVKMPLIDVMSIIGDKMYMGNIDFPYTKDNLIEIVM